MINIPQHDEHIISSPSNIQKNILAIMDLEEKVFSCSLNFSQGTKEEHTDLIETTLIDGIIDLLRKEHINNRN